MARNTPTQTSPLSNSDGRWLPSYGTISTPDSEPPPYNTLQPGPSRVPQEQDVERLNWYMSTLTTTENRGDWALAITILKQFMTITEVPDTDMSTKHLPYYRRLAGLYYNSMRWESMIEMLEKAQVTNMPLQQQINAHHMLAIAYLQRQLVDKAENTIRGALEIARDNVKAGYSNRRFRLFRRSTSFKRDPLVLDSYAILATVLYQKGDVLEAAFYKSFLDPKKYNRASAVLPPPLLLKFGNVDYTVNRAPQSDRENRGLYSGGNLWTRDPTTYAVKMSPSFRKTTLGAAVGARNRHLRGNKLLVQIWYIMIFVVIAYIFYFFLYM
ncbi:hypothetical protein H072_168 [Dactylellina haptotyla CBS 200.50]|uniref:Uncharacterized protein n=1 Tax=Dactylellina haptotyla (strain CBS 200.50) TaxID=1284197 RepID=S8CDL5_DACHA|nr:hypothetical protein H072_168 [Dactylellina haptotyla CBS 200.50]